MDDTRGSCLGQLFHTFCILCTMILTYVCISEYSSNEDIAQIKYKHFHATPEDIYPSVTFCLNHPFIKHKIGGEPGISEYRSVLQGINNLFLSDVARYQDWLKIDYDQVTFQLKHFLSGMRIVFLGTNLPGGVDESIRYAVKNESLVRDFISSPYNSMPLFDENLAEIMVYVSLRTDRTKCFTFDIPVLIDKYIKYVAFYVNGSIFPHGKISPFGDFHLTFGYPNQLFRSYLKNRVLINPQSPPTSCLWIQTYVGSMEVVLRRDKFKDSCNQDWQNYDQSVLSDIVNKVGCVPNYLKLRPSLPNCSFPQQYQKIMNAINNVDSTRPPCKGIEKLTQTTQENDLGIKCTFIRGNFNKLTIFVNFHKETMYKEVQLTRAYSLQSLVGNCGMSKYYI